MFLSSVQKLSFAGFQNFTIKGIHGIALALDLCIGFLTALQVFLIGNLLIKLTCGLLLQKFRFTKNSDKLGSGSSG